MIIVLKSLVDLAISVKTAVIDMVTLYRTTDGYIFQLGSLGEKSLLWYTKEKTDSNSFSVDLSSRKILPDLKLDYNIIPVFICDVCHSLDEIERKISGD